MTNASAFTSTHIYHITDTFDDRARGKIDGAYSNHRGKLGIREAGYSFIPAVNSVDAGISVSEFFTNTQRPDRLIIAVNYAPPDKKDGTTDNIRRDFFCATTKSGDVICGTSNGYELSYIKGEIDEVFRLTNTNSLKSQFRSLEILPEHTLLFSQPGERHRLISEGILERVTDIDRIIPGAPDVTHVFEIDNFQNVKLFPSAKDLELLRQIDGSNVRFAFGGASVEAGSQRIPQQLSYEGIVAPTLFYAPEGTNVVALRSSSKRLGVETNVPIIATIRQRPAETTPNYEPPRPGAPVWLQPVEGRLSAA